MVTSATSPTRSVGTSDASFDISHPVGILALQGDFRAHERVLEQLGFRSALVRRPDELADIGGLVIPGGESTTILKHFDIEPAWPDELVEFVASGRFVFGTCAGLILLARSVEPRQPSLGLLDIAVCRNGYGRQLDSRIERARWTGSPAESAESHDLEIVLIRAPRITKVGSDVEVLASYQNEPVLVRQGSVVGATFHPELSSSLGAYERVLASAVPPVHQTEAETEAQTEV